MYTKVLFINGDGDLCVDHVICAYEDNPRPELRGLRLHLAGKVDVLLRCDDVEVYIKALFNHDKFDLTPLGKAVWIFEDGALGDI